MKIKDIVKDNQVFFRRYRKGILYYGILCDDESEPFNGSMYEFPVPIEDCGDADFPATEKAIMFMRYIRKALEDGTFVKMGV